jgi:phosphoribosyl 1,2-cyclic phosphodiesterase
LLIKFWGVRGSISAPGAATARYGGNTPCVQVRAASGESFVLDAGYGAVKLSDALMASGQGRGVTVNFVLTHLHWDHIQGLPFFAPIYLPGNRIVIHSASEETARAAMDRLFTSAYSPIMGVENLGATIEYRTLALGSAVQLCGAELVPFPVRHSVPTLGLRIADGGHVLVHATDHEGGDAAADRTLCDLARGAELLVHDAQFTEAEYLRYRGWGHSSTEGAVRNALAAGVGRLVLFHYDATHGDGDVDAQRGRAGELARGSALSVVAAAEGLELQI